MNSSFWQGKKVFITGHTGFKGSWLSQWLLNLGAEVAGYSLAPDTDPNHFTLLGLQNNMQSHIGDIRNRDALLESLRSFKPEIVFHLAAQALVRRSYLEPVDTWATNVMGTVHLMEALRKTPSARTAVIVTTDKCYKNLELGKPFSEQDPLGGRDPYSASKAGSELVAESYRHSFLNQEHPVKMATARGGNVIGGGDWAKDRLVPDIVRSIVAQQPLLVRFPQATRPWQHVLDVCHGYLTLAEQLDRAPLNTLSPSYNFGPSRDIELTVASVLQEFKKLWPNRWEWIAEKNPNTFHEATHLTLDTSLALRELHWQPQLNLEQTIQWTALWYKNWFENPDSATTTLQQIKEYRDLCTN